ncbi:hypothetical protein [Kluyvera ascorbata]
MTINLTDPANHPANSPLVSERIERVIEALQRTIQYQNGGDMAYAIADAIKGLEELLVIRKAAADGWKLVPVEPTEDMIIDGFESEPDEDFSEPEAWTEYEAMSGCQQAAHRAKLCWAAMLSAAPTVPEQENV